MTGQMGSQGIEERPRKPRALASIIVAGLVAATLTALTGAAASAQSSPGVELIGELETGYDNLFEPKLVGIDAENRRLYAAIRDAGDGTGYKHLIGEYDLETELPTLLRTSEPVPNGTQFRNFETVVDPDQRRLLALASSPSGDGSTIIHVFDLDSLTLLEDEEMNLSEGSSVPGMVPTGMAYSAERDRIYLAGMLDGNTNTSLGFLIAGTQSPVAVVAAVDGQSGDLIWIQRLDSCDSPMFSYQSGTPVGLSNVRPMLYTFCKNGTTGYQPTGQAGLVRVDIRDESDASGLADFPQEFFPVSGQYDGSVTNSAAARFDPDRERMFIHSLSARTHGAWVFDGQRSSWIGFVAAPDDTNGNAGLDPATGKHYMAGGDTRGDEDTDYHGYGYINVTDGSATPVPQGRLFDAFYLDRQDEPADPLSIESDIVVDPATGRLFMGVGWRDGNTPKASLVAMRDTTPPITPRTPLDLDELTHDLPDEDAHLEFSAHTSGFGAQYVQVGGWENVYTRPAAPNDNIPTPAEEEPNPAQIRYGNRGATMSLMESIGISTVGSFASAISTQPDDNTPSDAETKQNTATNEVDAATEPVGGLPDTDELTDEPEGGDDEEEVDAPGVVTCLDGAGEPVTEKDPEDGGEASPAYAEVRCDLAGLETTGLARFSGGSGGGGLVVSDSSFDGRTYRDSDHGVVSETEAIAEGIFFGEAEVGGFGIDRVTSTATVRAKGLDGEAHVLWVREVEGARTFNPDGTANEPKSCTTTVETGKKVKEEGDCESLQKDLNELMPNRFEVKFPMPEIEATPGGAFASVQENETDYLSGKATNNDHRRMVPGMEITVFADGAQRGRLWTQLAAVKADATFIRSPKHDGFDGGSGGGGSVASGGESGSFDEPPNEEPAPTPEQSGAGPVAPQPDDAPAPPAGPDIAGDPVSHVEQFVGAFGWLPALRSAGDAALTGALYVLFLLPLAEVVRRRRLLDVLNDAPAGDAKRSPSKSSVPASMSPVGSTS